MRRAGEFKINTSLSGESDVDEKVRDRKQDLENKVLSGEFQSY